MLYFNSDSFFNYCERWRGMYAKIFLIYYSKLTIMLTKFIHQFSVIFLLFPCHFQQYLFL